MIDITTLKVGDKVHYIPFEDCDDTKMQNGIVKEIPNSKDKLVRVVYHCANEWDRYAEFTGQLTSITKLGIGWKNETIKKI